MARSLRERCSKWDGIDLVCIGRPDLDLEDPNSIRSVINDLKPDAVVSTAAYTAVDQAEDEPDKADRINAIAPGEIAAAANEINAAIIHLSTDYVFDGEKAEPYCETDPVNPNSVYGSSKLNREIAVRAANPMHVIVQTAWLYSPFGKNFVETMLELAAARDELRVVDDQIGSPSSALDLADAILKILDTWRQNPDLGLGKTFHLAGSGKATWCEFAKTIMEESRVAGGPHATVHGIASSEWPTKAARPKNSVLVCARFEACFGMRLPDWQSSTKTVLRRILGDHRPPAPACKEI